MIAYTDNGDGSYTVNCGLNIDGDGANGATGGVACYVPAGSGLPSLDYLANAGSPGDWWGIYCDVHGVPLTQDATMPVPGAYISTTSYQNLQFQASDPQRYLDAVAVPFIVVPRRFQTSVPGAVLGCKAIVTYGGVSPVTAVVGDIGPDFGEGSIALAKALGIPGTPKSGGVNSGVVMQIFPGVAAPGFQLEPA